MDKKEILKKYEDFVKEKKVLKNIVKVVHYDEQLESDVLLLDLDGFKGIIKKKDVDADLDIKSLVNFIGREVSFVALEVDRETGNIICSRAEAQRMTKENVMNRLSDGEAFPAQIINILKYGAYVEIEGVTGLLKNTDFAEDYTAIEEMHSIGETIQVKFKKVSENDTMLFEAVKKYKNPTIMGIGMFQPNQVVYGVIRSIKPFGIFVQIAPNLDALCAPATEELEEDMKVSVKITKVIIEENKVRGKIINVL